MPQEPETSRLLVGRYRLGPVLGRGAHGTVYLAEDLGRGGRHVALKLGTDPNEAPDFDDEATKALFWFRHPNWAEILDMGMVDDHQWFQTTRYVNGKSLDALEGPQDPELVWRFWKTAPASSGRSIAWASSTTTSPPQTSSSNRPPPAPASSSPTAASPTWALCPAARAPPCTWPQSSPTSA